MWLHTVHFRTVPYRTRTFNMPVRYGTRKQRTVHPPYTYIRNLCMVRYGTEGFVHYPLYGSKNVRYGTVRFDNVRYVEPSLQLPRMAVIRNTSAEWQTLANPLLLKKKTLRCLWKRRFGVTPRKTSSIIKSWLIGWTTGIRRKWY